MRVSLQDGSKEGRAGGEDHLVGLDLKYLQSKIRYLGGNARGKYLGGWNSCRISSRIFAIQLGDAVFERGIKARCNTL